MRTVRAGRIVKLIAIASAICLTNQACEGMDTASLKDMASTAAISAGSFIVKRALNEALKKAGIARPEKFVDGIFAFPGNHKEAARLFLEGARDNGLDREATNQVLEVIAGTSAIAEAAGGGQIASDIKEYALYMRGVDLGSLALSLGIKVAGLVARSGIASTGAHAVSISDSQRSSASDSGLPAQTSANFLPPAAQRSALGDPRNKSVPGRTGFLYVLTNPPGAQVVVKGPGQPRERSLGVNEVATVPTGCLAVEVSMSKWETATGMVCIHPDEVARVDVALNRLAPLFGRVTVISDPPSARVTIDGREVGTSPLTTDDMEEGDHAIAILGPPPQGLPWEGRVTVRAGTVTVVRVDLARPSPPSSASARSDVAGGTPDCATVCDRFTQVYTGPDSVREALRGQCMTRCQSGDVRFASCAANVRVTDDVQNCVVLRVVANAARATSIPGSVQTDRPAEPEKTFCDKVCERLAAPLAGVAPNARPSRRTCLSRCAKNDIGYIACAWKVRVEGDAWKCTLLPEPGTTGATGTNTAETETAKSNRVDCRAVCEKYGEAFDGDDAIRGSIREQCEGRCFNGDMKFSVCAWKARNMDDVQTCASIPETR